MGISYLKYKKTVKNTCLECKKVFITIASEMKRGKGKFCSRVCYAKYRKVSLLMEKNSNWKGGRYLNGAGYILLKNESHARSNSAGYVREHILSVSSFLGRALNKKEVIHHIDGDRKNNNLNNLFLFRHASAHSRFENFCRRNHLDKSLILKSNLKSL